MNDFNEICVSKNPKPACTVSRDLNTSANAKDMSPKGTLLNSKASVHGVQSISPQRWSLERGRKDALKKVVRKKSPLGGDTFTREHGKGVRREKRQANTPIESLLSSTHTMGNKRVRPPSTQRSPASQIPSPNKQSSQTASRIET